MLLVLTDGETRPLIQDLPDAFSKKPKIQVVFVRLWAADERIYLTGLPEVGYEPDGESEALLGQIASSIDARVVQESEAGSLPQIVGDLIGTGPTIDREHEGRRRALMPWITLAAVFPLGFVLFRRNA